MWMSRCFLKVSHIPCHQHCLSLKIKKSIQLIAASRTFHLSCQSCALWEPHRKGHERYEPKPQRTTLKDVKDGFRLLRPEFDKWVEEKKEYFRGDILIPPCDGELDVAFQFNGPDSLKGWIVSCDSDFNEGFSSAQLTTTSQGYGRFGGTLSTRLPKDGLTKASGWCNLLCPSPTKSFLRAIPYELELYTHLVLRVRGDGRTYVVNFHTPGYGDITWFDIFSYPLFTRGGPYWQVSKIPFAKFVQQCKGRVQDHQHPLPRDEVKAISFMIGDKNDGPFSLEIDYIGFELIGNLDPNEMAYETYDMPYYITG